MSPGWPNILAFVLWQGVLLVLAGGAALAWISLTFFRRGVRKNFLRYLKEHHPQIEILREYSKSLEVRIPNVDKSQINLHNLFHEVARAHAKTRAEEEKIFQPFITGLLEVLENVAKPMTLAADGKFLLPRLVTPNQLAEHQSHGRRLPHTPLGATGLQVIYVRDSTHAVEYIQEDHLKELSLDVSALHKLAVQNLLQKTPTDFIRSALKEKSLNICKFCDSFDAARLLLVPDLLHEGESVAAVIPDRDTLGICAVPENEQWETMKKFAHVNSGPALLTLPLRVTPKGFELVR